KMNELPLNTILSNPSVAMMVRITATTTSGKQLQPTDMERALRAADVMLELEENKEKILRFIASRMKVIASNTSALVGSEIAAKLLALTGSIQKLSQIPSCNIQVLGALKRNAQAGFLINNVPEHFGIIGQCELVRNCPWEMRQKALRLVAAKISLCARVDAHKPPGTFNATVGEKLHKECFQKIEKWQEPAPPKPPRPLP
ncbi:hypothetical protein RFI_34722, partial [Reticulomyxa filosa]